MPRRVTFLIVMSLCGASAVLGFRAARLGPPDAGEVIARWAQVYAAETSGQTSQCVGTPSGEGYVITCGTGTREVVFVTDRFGALIDRHLGEGV